VRQPARKSIGQALADLTAEFPDEDIKESKLRFLESEGLVEPERTPSGYRKYSVDDMERLRYIIRMQRDHYLPLKVIKEHLEAIDRGLEPPSLNGSPQIPAGALGAIPGASDLLRGDRSDVRVSRRELVKTAEITEDLLTQLEGYGLVRTRPGSKHYDADAVVIAKAAGELAAFGIEPRHLRAFRSAADREAGLVEQVVSPLRRQRGPEAAAHAEEVIRELSQLCVRLHATLVKSALERGGN